MNLYVYKCFHLRITNWPLGNRPADNELIKTSSRKSLRPESVLIFSPHPDDDVISMGATIRKLYTQNHEITIAYMTSGANGVSDDNAEKYIDFVLRGHREMGLQD